MVYGQTSRFVAAGGLLVTISKKVTLHPYSKIQLNPTRNPNSEVSLSRFVPVSCNRLQKLQIRIGPSSSRSHVITP